MIRGSIIRNLSENKSTAFIRSARQSSKNKALLLFEAQSEAAKTKHCFYSKRKAKQQKQSTAFIRSARRSGKNKALLLFEAQGEAAK
ncbi:hypothetical protein [Acinetobacter sp.]|uniref:hypothetical protein n=1 Tax=Acinetobacter sp. TaxID=472 RepID=UPI0035AE13C5